MGDAEDRGRIVVTGASGYLGRRLVTALPGHGARVVAVVRDPLRATFGPGVEVAVADALSAADLARVLAPRDVLVQLVGTPRPAPWKLRAFRDVDLASARAAFAAALRREVAHVVYVGVAHPAPVMRAYVAARCAAEDALAATGLDRTVLRPWYVLGPGHRWPRLLVPLYALARAFPPTRAGAERLGLLTLEEMTAALVAASLAPEPGVRTWDVPAIRARFGARGGAATALRGDAL